MIHGAGGWAKNITEGPLGANAETFLRRGFAVAASDANGPFTWGDPASVADYEHLISRLRQQGYSRIFLFGGSMGGLATMQLVGTVNPEAVALISPVCNIRKVRPELEANVELVWGATGGSYLAPVVPAPPLGLRVLIWSSPEDTWVPEIDNADICAKELEERGAHVVHKETTGDHSATPVPRDSLPDFFQR